MDQEGASIHRINDVFPLKPPLRIINIYPRYTIISTIYTPLVKLNDLTLSFLMHEMLLFRSTAYNFKTDKKINQMCLSYLI